MSKFSVDDTQPDSERPTKRRRKLPSRFYALGLELHDSRLQDVLPQPPPALPPSGMEVEDPAVQGISQIPLPNDPNSSHGGSQPARLSSRLRRTLETPRNSFGLFRRYFSDKFPSHDPESEVQISDLSNISPSNTENTSYGLYPNRNSFLLGNWYWNNGIQKSQASFKELLRIVGDINFQPSDVRSTNWDKISKMLADGDHGGGRSENEWVDEDEDASWTTSSVRISVPFHRHLPNPGLREYVVSNFHHQSLVSVIREKLTNENDAPHFHYEPYELRWTPSGNPSSIRIHGELYTSPAFMEAHTSLQESPGEPNCDLPRVIISLMFWSDSTQLTSFGNAKLWPLYMFFGNESKYRRGKPSCNLCEHVAYFETVHHSFRLLY